MDCSSLGSSDHGILQAWILERVAIPLSRIPPLLGDRTPVSCIAGRFFTIWAIREAQTSSDHAPGHSLGPSLFLSAGGLAPPGWSSSPVRDPGAGVKVCSHLRSRGWKPVGRNFTIPKWSGSECGGQSACLTRPSLWPLSSWSLCSTPPRSSSTSQAQSLTAPLLDWQPRSAQDRVSGPCSSQGGPFSTLFVRLPSIPGPPSHDVPECYCCASEIFYKDQVRREEIVHLLRRPPVPRTESSSFFFNYLFFWLR